MKHLFYLLLLATLALSCKQRNITDKNDYSIFLQPGFHQKKVNNNAAEIEFWQRKLDKDSGNYIFMYQIAQQKIIRFGLSGNPIDVLQADSLLEVCSNKLGNKEPGIFYARIQNAITQHQFKKAESLLNKISESGADPYVINLLSFDVNMELGKYNLASSALQKIHKKKNNFDFLIRSSKLNDHKGNSEQSLQQMEEALTLANKNKNEKQINWSITNLADKYSHEGNIKKSYDLYLQALRRDSANIYALKRIAAISLYHDKDEHNTLPLISFIQRTGNHPENYLLMAELFDLKGDETNKQKCLNHFYTEVTQPKYGAMYNKYIIEQELETNNQTLSGLRMAFHEIQNRATPETYAWLAYAFYKNGDTHTAQSVARTNVLEKTHEPEALFLMSIIFNKDDKMLSQQLGRKCEKSAFELGPAKYKILQSIKT